MTHLRMDTTYTQAERDLLCANAITLAEYRGYNTEGIVFQDASTLHMCVFADFEHVEHTHTMRIVMSFRQYNTVFPIDKFLGLAPIKNGRPERTLMFYTQALTDGQHKKVVALGITPLSVTVIYVNPFAGGYSSVRRRLVSSVEIIHPAPNASGRRTTNPYCAFVADMPCVHRNSSVIVWLDDGDRTKNVLEEEIIMPNRNLGISYRQIVD